ncbi:helix-turn-helix domain-containing protein [Cellulomonas edaphi]|uniref:XRE family transcriptional regulator n=1 Tax=Cellulomonas edaphi TaxID=3053468 RepID=A0ABT7S9N4_9CELL|nr:XRE family transcriptional regulator [Cellulomons edaphi]MDM7832333.1 XRE family transcriptional regulator [Cellulomons edaphi]
MTDIDDVLDAVGPRLRDLRTRRGRTLADVSEETGISVSTLSRLESGLRRPTLDLLLALAQAYRVPLDDLVGAPASGDPRVHPRPIKRGDRIMIPLTRHSDGVDAFKLILPGRSSAEPLPLKTHAGYEWLYVLAGTLSLALGDTVTTLTAGEAAEFDTRTPHAMSSGDTHPVELLGLFSPQGEQIHLRDE